MKYLQIKKEVLELEKYIKREVYWARKETKREEVMRTKIRIGTDWYQTYANLCAYRNRFDLKENDPLWTKMRELQKMIGIMGIIR